MEKLEKQFTRDFSLFTCEWWGRGLIENIKLHLGRGYDDYIVVSDGKAATSYYISRNLPEIKDALIRKIGKDPDWYSNQSRIFRKEAAKSREIVKKIKKEGKLGSKAVEIMGQRLLKLMPMLRLSILVPSNFAAEIEGKLGERGKKIIETAYQDRIKSDGVFEAIDYTTRDLVKRELIRIGQDPMLAKHFTAKEAGELGDGNLRDLREIKLRSKGYVLSGGKIFPTANYRSVFKEKGYVYTEELISGQLHGNVAYDGGSIKGRVRRIVVLEDVHRFKKGEVLVSPMTVPDFLPAMKKAAAIVTDEGGITCHAAIVARELKVPCVIGTKNATRILKDGDLVEVDSHTGKVGKIG